MYLKTKNIKIAMAVYWILLLYITASLIWWFIALSNQNNQVLNLKLNNLKKDDTSYQLKFNALQEDKNNKNAQYIGEGGFFLLCILIGAGILIRALKKEVKTTQRQQSFMMAITHELKTPIAIAKLNLETLQKHKLNEAQQEKLLSNTLQETNRLDSLCDNLLITTQIDEKGYEPVMEKINLSQVAKDCADGFAIRYPNRKIIQQISNDIYVKGDKFLLQMLANNLIENALKYTHKEKQITIQLQANTYSTNLKIIDEGFGIKDEDKVDIFKKYYRIGNAATKAAKGTGLGLYLVDRITKTHDANITIENNPSGGSIFTFTQKVIPIAHAS